MPMMELGPMVQTKWKSLNWKSSSGRSCSVMAKNHDVFYNAFIKILLPLLAGARATKEYNIQFAIINPDSARTIITNCNF